MASVDAEGRLPSWFAMREETCIWGTFSIVRGGAGTAAGVVGLFGGILRSDAIGTENGSSLAGQN
jgi:hypothetical protein